MPAAENLWAALQESFEWADLRTLTDNEIKPHSQHPLPGLARLPILPAPARSGPIVTLPATPVVPGATSEQVLWCKESRPISCFFLPDQCQISAFVCGLQTPD